MPIHYPPVYHYLSLFPTSNIFMMTEQQLRDLCFEGIRHSKTWGYGKKRIGVKIQGTITDKVPFSGFGFKNADGFKDVCASVFEVPAAGAIPLWPQWQQFLCASYARILWS